MGRVLLWIAVSLVLAPTLVAQSVTGRVTSSDGTVSHASVVVEGTTHGVLTASDGTYRLNGLSPGRHVIVARAQGYAPRRRTVDLRAGGSVRVDFELPVRAVEAEPVVVTGTRREVRLSDSPVRVEVVSAEFLRRTPTSSLVQAIETVNGLYRQVDCGVCYTSNIRINGLEGPYTAVLIDGTPIMSSLATVYGLDGIDPSLIEQIEVIRGPASTLYGAEAMAGVINVITKDPRFAPRMSVDVFRTSAGETDVDVALAPTWGDVHTLVSGNMLWMDRFVDDNGDGFTDLPQQRRASLFAKASWLRGGENALDVSGRLYFEDRFGGVRGWTREDRGSARVYGENVVTRRAELIGRYRPAFAPEAVQMEFSLSDHSQDSYYGDIRYRADQRVSYGTVQWAPPLPGGHDLLLGASVRHQVYDDNTPATAAAERRWVPGVFAQDEIALGNRVRLLAGARVDRHAEHGPIYSPRLSLRWDAGPATTFRLNSGTGFRVVNLFTEDHAAYTGARDVRIEEDLRPERSRSVSVSATQTADVGAMELSIDADLFHTRFSNKILPDYDTDPQLIFYRNLDGHSVSRGVAVSVSAAAPTQPLKLSAGGTWMDVYSVRSGERERELYAPELMAVYTASYSWPGAELGLDLTGRITGPMRLPAYPEPFARPTRSAWYSVHNIQLTKHLHALGAEVDAYVAATNLLDYTQPTPLVAPEDPFGADFDTAYVYGPMHGRSIVIGTRWGLPK